MRTTPAAAGLSAVVALAVTACSQAPSPVGSGAPSPPTTSPKASAPAHAASSDKPLFPLTGLPAARAASAARPAVALAVSGSDPTGLGSADLVFEQTTSPVRYIAVYQSGRSNAVGPIGPTQPTDREILPVLHPLFGYDGAAAGFFVKLLDKTKITDASYGRYPSLYTSGPGGLTASTEAISRGVSGGGSPPQLLPYRGTGSSGNTLASTGMSRPTAAQVTLPGLGTQDWAFSHRADRWRLTSGGPSVQVANLIIQTVSYQQVNVNVKHGIVVPNAQMVGTGRVEVLSGSVTGRSGGTAASGTWSRLHRGQITTYLDSGGNPMAFQPGPTWVILAQAGTRVATSG